MKAKMRDGSLRELTFGQQVVGWRYSELTLDKQDVEEMKKLLEKEEGGGLLGKYLTRLLGAFT